MKKAEAYISPERLGTRDEKSRVPARNLTYLEDDLLAGDIILLWRIQFGTFTTESWFPKYLEYDYGIEGPSHLRSLVEKGYVRLMSAFASLRYLNAGQKRELLEGRGIKGLSRLKSGELELLLADHYSEEALGECFSVRGYCLTEKGKEALEKNQAVIDRHPKKGG